MTRALLALALLGCGRLEPEPAPVPPTAWLQDGAAYATGLSGHCELSVSYAEDSTDVYADVTVDGHPSTHYAEDYPYFEGDYPHPGGRVDVRIEDELVPDEVVTVRLWLGDAPVEPTAAEALCTVTRE